MDRILEARERIYNYFELGKTFQKYLLSPMHGDKYTRYYTSMYLLQDSTEGLQCHVKCGFNTDSSLAYIELLGIMQAVIVQQDSISTLYDIIVESKYMPIKHGSWKKIRQLRNQCAGHPGDNNGNFRSFFGRFGISYDSLSYERKDKKNDRIEFLTVNYGELLQEYTCEAVDCMATIEGRLRQRWPQA